MTTSRPRDGYAGKESLRIEMVLPTLFAAGMETVVAHLALRLAERGHDVSVTCLEEGGELAERLAGGGVGVKVLPTRGIATNVRSPALEAWLASRSLDVLHSHSGTWLKSVRAARRVGVPKVLHTVHGLLDRDPWYGGILVRLAARQTDVLTTVSVPLLDHVRRRHALATTAVVIPNGIDLGRFAPRLSTETSKRAGRREVLGDWSDALVIGHVARLVPVKNQALLLRAFQQVAQRVPRTRLVILGDGPLRAELVAQSADLGITDKIRFVGAVADVAPWLREFDVVALSSNAEGMSISILEALATGLCVVATNVGGNGELLDHGRAGRLVPPGDVSAFADALTAVLTNEPLRVRLGRAGRAHVERHYGDATMVDAYEQLYRGVLPEHG